MCECDLLVFLTRAEQNVALGTADPFQLYASHSPAESAESLCLNELSEGLWTSHGSRQRSDVEALSLCLLSDPEKSGRRSPACAEGQRAEPLLPPAGHQRHCSSEASSATAARQH